MRTRRMCELVFLGEDGTRTEVIGALFAVCVSATGEHEGRVDGEGGDDVFREEGGGGGADIIAYCISRFSSCL